MNTKAAIKLFEQSKVRSVYDEEKEQYFFSIIDVVAILTQSPNSNKYWSVLKTRLKAEGSQLTTNCSQLKMKAADGKMQDKNYLLNQKNIKKITNSKDSE